MWPSLPLSCSRAPFLQKYSHEDLREIRKVLWKGNSMGLVQKMRQNGASARKKYDFEGKVLSCFWWKQKQTCLFIHTHKSLACKHWFNVHFTPNYPHNNYRKSRIVTKLKITSRAPLAVTAGIKALLPLLTFPSYNVCPALNYPTVGASYSSIVCKIIFLDFTSLQPDSPASPLSIALTFNTTPLPTSTFSWFLWNFPAFILDFPPCHSQDLS